MLPIKEIISNPELRLFLIGVAAGAIASFLGHWLLNHYNQKQRIKGIYQGICRDLNVLWDLYDEEVGITS